MRENIDCVMQNYKKRRLLIMEVKHYGASPDFAQKETYKTIHNALRLGLPKIDYTYLGCHLLQFTKKDFSDGAFLDQQPITESEFFTWIKNMLELETPDEGLDFSLVDHAIEQP